MVTIKHVDKQGFENFKPDKINSIYIFALKKLDSVIEYDQPLTGEDYRYQWKIENTSNGYNIVIIEK